jgi:hypothetical protein
MYSFLHSTLNHAIPFPFSYGCYTDDTEMTLALAASIVQQFAQAKLQAGPGKPIAHMPLDGRATGLAYGAAFDPKRGYGGTTVKVMGPS